MLFKNSNKLLKYNGKLFKFKEPPPPLPPYTLRLKYKEGVTPTFSKGTGVQVSSSPNIWDLTYENSNWENILYNHTDLLEVLSANSTGVTNMSIMFWNCTSLTTVPLFDTSSVTNMFGMFVSCTSLTTVPLFDTSNVTSMENMFLNCTSLTSIPLFDTSKVTNMNSMFNNCINVEIGALSLYQQASSQANPPSSHDRTFYKCGSNTTTGAAELAQISWSWK